MRTTPRRLHRTHFAAAFALLALGLLGPAPARAQWTQPDSNNNISSTNTGNVGVGTSAPAGKLEVKGSTSDSTASALSVKSSSDASLFFVRNDGKAGFGTTSPGVSLDVQQDSASGLITSYPLIRAANRNTTAGDGSSTFNRVGFRMDVAGGVVQANLLTTYETGGDMPTGLYLRTSTNHPINLVTNNATRLTVDGAGNVGIGTASPAFKLDVAGFGRVAGNGAGLTVKNNNGWTQVVAARTGAMQAAFIAVPTVPYDVNNPYWAMGLSPDGSAGWSLDTWDGAKLITRVRVLPGSGNFGIGTVNPAHRLDVAGNVNASGLCIAGDCKTSWSQVGSSGPFTQLAVDAPSGYGARLVVGQPSVDYPGNAGWAASWNSNLLLNGADSTSISFHDSNARVDTLRVAGGTFNIGENVGWGVANARVHGSLFANGSLGVGTTTPNGKFEVAGGPMFLGDMGNAGWGNVVVRGRVFSASNNIHLSPPGGSAVVINSDYRDAGGSTGPVNLHVSGDVTVGGNITAKFQDVAEWVPSTQKLAAGTVVVLDPGQVNHVLASTSAYDTRVAGVVSARPGLILGEGGEGKLLVATTGRVKVKVDATRGPIRVGDLLVTGGAEGVAMKSVPVEIGGITIHRPGTIIGKALEPLAGGVGEILVLLSLQ